jgi:hypothetical protein
MLEGGTKLLSLHRACRSERSAIRIVSPNIIVRITRQLLYLIYLIFYKYNTIHRLYLFITLFGNSFIKRAESNWKHVCLLDLSGLLKARPYSDLWSWLSIIWHLWLLEIVAALLLHPLRKSIPSMITRTQKCRGLSMPFVVSTLALCQRFSLLNYSRRNALDCWSLDISRVGNPRHRIPRSS